MAVKHILKRAFDVVKTAAQSASSKRTEPGGGRGSGRRRSKRGRAAHRPGSGHVVHAPDGAAPASDIPDLDGISISYSPEPGRDADPGEVVWTWVPYEEDPSQGKDRPVVLFGRRGAHLVGVALTTKADHDDQVLVGTGAWDSERRPSYAKLDRVLDVDGARVRRVGGVMDRDRFDDLIAALRAYYR